MPKIVGRLQNLAIATVDIAGIVDATLNGEVAEIGSTSHDDTSETFVPGRFSGTIDGTMRWDDAAAGQEDLKTAFFAKTTDSYRFRMETGSGFDEFTANGFVTSFTPTGPNDDIADWSFAIRVTGDLTRAPQA